MKKINTNFHFAFVFASYVLRFANYVEAPLYEYIYAIRKEILIISLFFIEDAISEMKQIRFVSLIASVCTSSENFSIKNKYIF